MFSTRWIKLYRDVQLSPARIALMMIAIGAGVFGLTTMLSSYVILEREIRINYLATNPASATLKVDRIDTRLLEIVRSFPGVAAVQGSNTFHTSIINDKPAQGSPQEIRFFIPLDFSEKTITRISPESGAFPPPPDSILLERESLKQLQLAIGDSITIDLGDGRTKNLVIAGTVHDPSMPTPNMSAFAYATLATMASLSDDKNLHDLNIIVSDKQLDAKHIEAVVSQLSKRIEQLGYHVERIQIPPPGEHPHQAIMQGVLIMLMFFSFLALLLSSILSASIIEGLLVQQRRQMAVMKAIGASFQQIAALYFTFILVISGIATAIAIPAGLSVGTALSKLVLLQVLNFKLHSSALPSGALMLLVCAGVLIPLAFTAWPIIKTTRISVHTALSQFGTQQQHYPESKRDIWLSKFGLINPSMLMSLRNCFRNRARLILSLALLSSAGAMFISSLNVKNASQQHLLDAAAERHYQLEVISKRQQDAATMKRVLLSIPGIEQVEAWLRGRIGIVGKSGIEIEHTYPDGGHGSLSLIAVPNNSQLMDLKISQGRSLDSEDIDSVVLNQKAWAFFPNSKVGDKIRISSAGQIRNLQLIGITQQKMTGATAYVSPLGFTPSSKDLNSSRHFKLVSSQQTDTELANLATKIRTALKDQQISIATIVTETMLRNEVDGHFDLLILSLLFIALLMAVVGTLGLSATISSNVVERTRELGIMRSLGASKATIMRNIIVEASMITAISYIAAILLALPLSFFMGRFLGELLMEESFPLVLSLPSLTIWLLVITVIGIAASTIPAWRSAQMSIREALVFQ